MKECIKDAASENNGCYTKIREARSCIALDKKKKELIPYKIKKRKEKEGKKEEILCHGNKACISEWSRGGNREKMPEEQTSSWVVISVHAKGNPWRDLSHVSATKKNRKTVLE